MTRAPRPTPREIEVTIGELVLEGWPESDRDRIADAFRRELSALLARRPPPAWDVAPSSREAIDAGTFAGSRRPESVGESIARRVYRAIGRLDDSRRSGRTAP